MMVMLQYSLDGTAYGGAYDNTIGAFWAAPNRLKDPNSILLPMSWGIASSCNCRLMEHMVSIVRLVVSMR